MTASPDAIALPYPDAASHLFHYLERLAWLLGSGGDRADVLARVAARDADIAAREQVSAASLPLLALARRAGLDVPAIHLLIAAALPSLDVDLGAALAARTACGQVQELIAMLAFAPSDEAVLLAELASDAPLRARGLVTLTGGDRTPLLQRQVEVDDRIAGFLRGIDVIDPRLADVATLHVAAPATTDAGAVAVLRHVQATPGAIAIEGPARAGKTTVAVAAITAAGGRALVADLAAIVASTEDAPCALLARVRREALLLGATLVLRGGAWSEGWSAALRRDALALVADGAAILTVRDGDAACRDLIGARRIRVGAPSALDQQRVWRAALAGAAVSPNEVCARYPLPPGDIVHAAAAARAHAEVERRPMTSDDLVTAARARLCSRLGDVAELVTTSLTWDDLVLPEAVTTLVLEIVAAVHFRERVMSDWGFGGKLPYGRAVSAMFSGAPGTGKTMVATLIGKELGLEVFRVDLSKVVSKYIGETEKNLNRVFEEAGRCRAVVLFDEADSLFAKRTEVKSSNDRYANLEVNFLLQRLEQYDGVVLLTTNAATAIDPAFLRRLRYRVEFPEPEDHERAKLWRAMIPARAPLAADVDFAALGRRFKLTGGHIKNAAVRAAYLAVGDNLPAITQAALVRAATLEWTELGNLPSASAA